MNAVPPAAKLTPARAEPAVVAVPAPTPLPRSSLASEAAARRAERRAWLVLWLAFATFCLLLLSAIKLGADYVSTAEIDLPARVEGSRGVVFMQTDDLPEERRLVRDEVTVGTTIAPARAASTTLRLFEGTQVTVLSGARVRLARMDVGRFIAHRNLALEQPEGPVRYQTVETATVNVPGGLVRLGPRADVTVWVEENRTRVLVYGGEARLEANGSSLLVADGFRGELNADHTLRAVPRAEDLLVNGDFGHRGDGWQTIDVQNGPRDVDGQRMYVPEALPDGQLVTALSIRRDSTADSHGETGLRQKVDLDVGGFRHLYVDAWVRVDGSSLSGGGQLGTEYPAMLRLHYEGLQEGSRPDWVHGFFYANPENRPIINAEPLPQGVWKHYRVDLLAADEPSVPFHLLDFEVMGQGHSYDARFANVRLIGD